MSNLDGLTNSSLSHTYVPGDGDVPSGVLKPELLAASARLKSDFRPPPGRSFFGERFPANFTRAAAAAYFHSAFQVTVKLAPSEARADGRAVTLPLLLPLVVVMDSCTSLPKSLITPEAEESVASSLISSV